MRLKPNYVNVVAFFVFVDVNLNIVVGVVIVAVDDPIWFSCGFSDTLFGPTLLYCC